MSDTSRVSRNGELAAWLRLAAGKVTINGLEPMEGMESLLLEAAHAIVSETQQPKTLLEAHVLGPRSLDDKNDIELLDIFLNGTTQKAGLRAVYEAGVAARSATSQPLPFGYVEADMVHALERREEVALHNGDKEALKWAAQKADEWHGNVTGDYSAENHHTRMMSRVRAALVKVGIKSIAVDDLEEGNSTSRRNANI